jgi:1-phosphofructokinase family hexose kinase
MQTETMEASRPDILTITPNPSLDLLHDTDAIAWDDANRVSPPRRRAGGQGINVSRSVVALGGTTHAVAPLGGRTGDELRALIEDEGIPATIVSAPGETRIFAALRETSTGRSILINPRGETFSAEQFEHFRSAAESAILKTRPKWVACCGSVPPGFSPDFYASLAPVARRAGARFTADCDGEALRLAVASGTDLVVPNRFEAERLTGRRISDVPSAIDAAHSIAAAASQGSTVVITLGGDGAVLVSEEFAAHAHISTEGLAGATGSAVGAGDAFLAATLLSFIRGSTLQETLAAGVAAGTSALYGTGAELVNTGAYRTLLNCVTLMEVK